MYFGKKLVSVHPHSANEHIVEFICLFAQNYPSNGELVFKLLPYRDNRRHFCVHVRKVGYLVVIVYFQKKLKIILALLNYDSKRV